MQGQRQTLSSKQRHIKAEPEVTPEAWRDRAGTAREQAAHSWASACEYQGGGQTTSTNNRACPSNSCLGTEGKLVLQAPAPVTAQAPRSTSQAEPGPSVTRDGKTCVQP